MGIEKEFEVDAIIHLDGDDQRIYLEVADIRVQGGFLVRKGFELIEPTIRKKVESAININVEETVENLAFDQVNDRVQRNININPHALEVTNVSFMHEGQYAEIFIGIRGVKVDIKTTDLV